MRVMTGVGEVAGVDRQRLRTFIRGVYDCGKVVGETGKEFPLRPHGVPEQDGEALRDLAVRENALQTLETGFGFGLASLFLCEAIAASGRGDARHVAIDPRQNLWHRAGVRTIREAGASDLVELHESGSEFVLPQFVRNRRDFDFALIGGDHRFDGVFLDLYYIHQLVKPRGVIVVTDVWMPAVRLAVTYFVNNIGWEIEPIPIAGATFTGDPTFLREQIKAPPRARTAVLRRPVETPERRWDDFRPFADWSTGNSPIRKASGAARHRVRSVLGGRGRDGRGGAS